MTLHGKKHHNQQQYNGYAVNGLFSIHKIEWFIHGFSVLKGVFEIIFRIIIDLLPF